VNLLVLTIAWCILWILCWPLALAILVLAPLLWLLALPFRLVALCVDALFALVRSVLFLPARILGYRGRE
jgi:hypothetical protein